MASQVSTPGSEVLPFSARAPAASAWMRPSPAAASARESAERSTPAPRVMTRWTANRASGGIRAWVGVSGCGTGAGTRAWRPFSRWFAAMSSAMRSA